MNVRGRIVRRSADRIRTASGLEADERPYRGVFYVRAESADVRNSFHAECSRRGIRRVRIANDVEPGAGRVVDAWECHGSAAALDSLTACGFVVDTHFVMDCRPPAFRTGTYDTPTGVRQSVCPPVPKDVSAAVAKRLREMRLSPTEVERRQAAADRATHPEGGIADRWDRNERAGLPPMADRPNGFDVLPKLAELALLQRQGARPDDPRVLQLLAECGID